jgi:hypothetical protein
VSVGVGAEAGVAGADVRVGTGVDDGAGAVEDTGTVMLGNSGTGERSRGAVVVADATGAFVDATVEGGCSSSGILPV